MNVRSLFIYPVKSCRGIALDRAELGLPGLALDRRWMVADAGGRFVTQRDLPRMALIDVGVHGAELELSAPERGRVRVPLRLQGAPTPVQVWNDEVLGVVHVEGSRWIGGVLGGDYRLVYMPDHGLRAVNPARGRPGDVVSFADAYPLLLVSACSLDDLNRRLVQPIGVERFRPNVVISGDAPYAEDGWRRIAIGSVRFRVAKLCDRCTIPTVDPATGERGSEPLRTLATYRKWDGKVWFGVNLIPDAPGTLAVGDDVRPIQ